ncbi:MAG: minor capsid protein [Clostridiales bacterium]|nr:minor capsid protein [Clostridiales bacterium]
MTYWEKRGAQLEQLADKRTRATAQKVAHLYDEALERIEEKIKKIYTTFTGNSHISVAEATRLMSVQQTKEARKELLELLERTTDQALRQELITQLNAPAYGYRIAALEALRDQVYFEAKAIGNDSVAYTESRLKDLYDLGYYRTTFDLSQYGGSNVPFSQLSGDRVEAAINAYWTPDVDTLAGNYSTRIWADTTQLAENVRDIVTRGLMTGGNYADMAAELAAQMGDVQFTKKVEADGSTRTVATGSGAKYRATRLIRTEGNYITGQAKLQSMKDAGYEKYEFICLLETRTCSVCGGLDGKQFPVEEAQPGVNMNPMHPNCRCFVSPVVSKRLMEAGTRGAQVDATGRKETVPASMTYQEWYEKYVKGNGETAGRASTKQDISKTSTARTAANTPQTQRNEPEDVLDEYLSTATPGEGTITFDDGYDKGKFKDEVATAQWLHDNLGGDIHVLQDINRDKIKTPDYLWRGKFWDLKCTSTEKAANSAIRHGIKQISENPGGIILNFGDYDCSLDTLWKIVDKRMGWYEIDLDILAITKNELIGVRRYKK